MKRLFASLICMLLLFSGAYAQKIYLVAAGISDYPGNDHDLRLPAKDAKKVCWLYQKNKKASTVLLTDSKATKSSILSNIKKQFAKAGKKDIVVFYFSGHGYPGGFVCHNDEELTYGEVRKAMSLSQSLYKMIFADACFSGNMRENKNGSGSSNSNANVMLFLSSRDNETSLESPFLANGFFTTALQNGLRGGADADKNRTITAKELFNYVSKEVKKLSNDEQHPVMWGKFKDSMPVMVW